MRILTKIKEWLSSIRTTAPDTPVRWEITFEGETKKYTQTAKESDDFIEAFFKERFFGTKKEEEVDND